MPVLNYAFKFIEVPKRIWKEDVVYPRTHPKTHVQEHLDHQIQYLDVA